MYVALYIPIFNWHGPPGDGVYPDHCRGCRTSDRRQSYRYALAVHLCERCMLGASASTGKRSTMTLRPKNQLINLLKCQIYARSQVRTRRNQHIPSAYPRMRRARCDPARGLILIRWQPTAEGSCRCELDATRLK